MNDDVEEGENIKDDLIVDGQCTSPTVPLPDLEGWANPRRIPGLPDTGVSVRYPLWESQKLHGEEALHEAFNDILGNGNKAAEVPGYGPQILEERDYPILNNSIAEGPTPATGLGKRSRDVRSPPSTGSMQGPPLRNFDHCFGSDEPSFDLIRPVTCPRSADGEGSGSKLMQEVSGKCQLNSENLRLIHRLIQEALIPAILGPGRKFL
ncbi:hypothetical protein Hanom_Chr00s000004g01607451 [Helianthus anomalus]